MNPTNEHLTEQQEEKLGFTHENLEGWVPTLATDSEVHEAIEKAFDYRGDLTITLKDGRVLNGIIHTQSERTLTVKMIGQDVTVE